MRVTRLRNRQRLRRREVVAIRDALAASFGCETFGEDDDVDALDADGARLLLLKGRVVGMLLGERALLSVRGAIAFGPTRGFVTVDMGAVRFVYNGADVMAPGVVDADPAIRVGDPVWVRDVRNGQPLAVGEALMTGPEMVSSRKGKSVRSIHHVGDDVWKLDEEGAQTQ